MLLPARRQSPGDHGCRSGAGQARSDDCAGGAIRLSVAAAQAAFARDGGRQAEAAAFGIVEVSDENMAYAARAHAVENGKNIGDDIMIAWAARARFRSPRCAPGRG